MKRVALICTVIVLLAIGGFIFTKRKTEASQKYQVTPQGAIQFTTCTVLGAGWVDTRIPLPINRPYNGNWMTQVYPSGTEFIKDANGNVATFTACKNNITGQILLM